VSQSLNGNCDQINNVLSLCDGTSPKHQLSANRDICISCLQGNAKIFPWGPTAELYNKAVDAFWSNRITENI